MRRFVIVVVLCLVAVSASASYKIFLVSGETILADEKPQVKEGTAYFIKGGVTFSMAASKIDFEKSEKTALLEAAGPRIEQIVTTDKVPTKPAKPAPVMKVNDESLDKIRQRSRLANEGEFSTPEPAETSEGAKGAGGKGQGASGVAQGAQTREQAQERVRQLEQTFAQAESERNQMRNSVSDLKQRYDSSIQQEDKTALWSQYESARESLAAANSKADEAAAQLGSAKAELSSMPLVVELPQGEGK